ncbi:DUF1254 domain-containing protein [Nocardia cyriacigeorgica]|uniref:DUF1254 domain-containing protein n=1 Tax=Nocardia cyriacigeorgica TaxID=135487 RepID=UPI000CEA23E5|nr:DUF1254 domain-containing protein [Nocardia cyriacigeorgica]PPJ01909.1 DUF1254 domain-containing protein [Nocardia cyriacigeorgica]
MSRTAPKYAGPAASDSASDERPAFSRRAVLGAMVAAAGLAACGESADDGSATPSGTTEDRIDVATQAYIFGFPLVLMDANRKAMTAGSGNNQFLHGTALPVPSSRGARRIGLDSLYSSAWLDLRDEPMVLQVPEIDPRRYWVMPLLDAWTNTVHNPSSVRPQAERPAAPYTYLISGPGWSGEVPEGMRALPMPTRMVWLLGRIQVNGPDDVPAVREIQAQLKLLPLSAWPPDGEPSPAAAGPGELPEPPVDVVTRMSARDFFDRMCELMDDNPPAPEDAPALDRFATIGITPGGHPRGISSEELSAGKDTAQRQIAVYLDPGARLINGWVINTDIGRYGTNYLLRAGTADRGLGANLPEDVMYPILFGDAGDEGLPVPFRLRFAPGQTPPVDAFWSLTAYGPEGHLVANPAGIYSIGHQVPVVFRPDGALELAVQYADPGSEVPAGNWLPIPPAGQFSLVLRMYAPKEAARTGAWVPPPLEPVT